MSYNDRDQPPEGASEDSKIVAEAKERFTRCQNWESGFRNLYIIDTKFANGDSDNGWQWPDDLRRDREVNKRPSLTINKVGPLCAMITNDGRQNMPDVNIKPTGGDATFEAAQTMEGIYRHIAYRSNAASLFDSAFESAVEGGIGWVRIVTDYEDDDSFDQEILFAPVRDHLAVYLDPDIKMMDGSDAKYGFVFDDVPRKEFERANPKVEVSASTGLGEADDWVRDDNVRVAEYYRILETTDELIYLVDEQGKNAKFKRSEMTPALLKLLEAAIARGNDYKSRKVKKLQLEWYKIGGSKIIARRKLKGKYIPLIRVVGKERVIEGKLERKGHVRTLKDPQRMYNYNSPLALDTPLPTPSGWTTMGEVKIGDWLFDENGRPVQVAGMSPIHVHRKCYRVEFDDGSHIVADGEHKWTVEERGKRRGATWDWSNKTICTEELAPKKHFIYSASPLDLPNEDLPIHPYVLGAWLGDGTSASGAITAGADDVEEMRANLMACGPHIGEPRFYNNKSAATLTIFGIRKHLSKLGVLGNKHIPQAYLRASREQREMLLRGLMDTDGNISENKQCSFVNTNLALVEGFSELLSSLGIKPVRRLIKGAARKFPSGNTYECQDAHRFAFSADPDQQVFWLSRKANKQTEPRPIHARRTKRHSIVSVIEVTSVPVRCVGINSESHLFLAGPGMVPTHNSSQIEYGALATKTPWIVATDSISGNEVAWNNANRNNAAYLTYKHVDEDGNPIPAPQRAEPPGASPAFLEGMKIAATELEMASGQTAPQQANPLLERTPQAVNAREKKGEVVTGHFQENLALAVRYAGRIIIDLIPYYLDTERVVKILGKDGTQSDVKIDPGAKTAYEEQRDGDEVTAIFNPNVGKYEVQSETGPSYATQREQAWDAFVQIASKSPDFMNEFGDLMFQAADFPMADKLSERFMRKIKQTMPWLLDDGAMNPAVSALQKELGDKTEMVTELMQKLAEMKLSLKGKDEKRDIDAYDSETARMKVIIEAIVEQVVGEREKAKLAHELEARAHDHVYSMIEQTNAAVIDAQKEPAGAE